MAEIRGRLETSINRWEGAVDTAVTGEPATEVVSTREPGLRVPADPLDELEGMILTTESKEPERG